MSERRTVQYALRQIGFIGLGQWDWIFQVGSVTCAIPFEQTRSFKEACHFLREGAFQSTLKRETRLAYYRLANMLDQYHSQERHRWIRKNPIKIAKHKTS